MPSRTVGREVIDGVQKYVVHLRHLGFDVQGTARST